MGKTKSQQETLSQHRETNYREQLPSLWLGRQSKGVRVIRSLEEGFLRVWDPYHSREGAFPLVLAPEKLWGEPVTQTLSGGLLSAATNWRHLQKMVAKLNGSRAYPASCLLISLYHPLLAKTSQRTAWQERNVCDTKTQPQRRRVWKELNRKLIG